MKLTYPQAVHVDDSLAASEEFRADVIEGLSCREKHLPCKYFYDEMGSKLFEEICTLDEYYPTRTELGILERSAGEMGELLGKGCLVIEYGSGASIKTRLLLEHLAEPAGYMPIDVAREQLLESAVSLEREYPGLNIWPVCDDFTRPLDMPTIDAPVQRRVVYFPGSTIGNLTPHEAVDLLRNTARLCCKGGGLLLGADLKKEPRVLHQAYNDDRGVTAAFNLNLLVRINRELGGTFRPDRFWHHAFYDPTESRVEMHLVSQQDQQVSIEGERFCFSEGESIRTEYSHKYSLADLRNIALAAGFMVDRIWTDKRNYFTVQYWAVRSDGGDRG